MKINYAVAFVFCFGFVTQVFAKTEHSQFEIKFGSSPATLDIAWSEDEIKTISVLDKNKKKLQTLDATGDWTNLGSPSDHLRKDIVKSEDADFDGLNDLLIEASSGSAGQLFRLFLYDSKKNIFVLSNALDEIWNPQFDPVSKIVQGGQGAAMQKKYKWSADHTLKVVK
jgi:hypothetical protein